MKKLVLSFFLVFYTCSSYANDEDLQLISTKYSNTKACQSFKFFKATDNFEEIRESFDMMNEDFLTISFKNKQNQECYTAKYYPDASAFLYFKMSNNQVKITEMSGTASSGNWFDKIYKVDIKHQKLKYIKTKFYH